MTPERWFAAACLTCLLLGAVRAADDADAALRSELSQGLRKDLPSVSMAIATRRGVVWSGAVGYSDLETHTPADPAELYGIGSITKTFVACVIEQLVDEGRLSLEANGRELLGAEVLSGIPNADRATVRELLSHRSGVPSWELDREWIRRGRGAELEPDRIWGKAETLDYLRSGRDPATNEPGQGYAYSNTNYTLLGLVIEKVTGRDAVAEVHRRILDPLGLKDVHFEGFERIDAHRLPSRYHFGTAEFAQQAGMHPMFRRVSPLLIDVTRSNLSVEWTAGAMLATMDDLALFMLALRDGRVVGRAALARMQKFQATDDPDEDMGQGLARDRYGAETLIGYTGNVLGFGAAAGWVPGDDVVIALATNVGAMHAGDSAYYPEKLLKETSIIAAARTLAHNLQARR
jgi:D-alanyl-D-alanine carboxypeptidase